MNKLFKNVTLDINFTGNLDNDSINLLLKYNRKIIANHSVRVANKCAEIAKKYGMNERDAYVAGLLHDIGGIFSNDERIDVCQKLNIEILEEERKLPLILHQKISKHMAKDIFDITNEEVLNAIECHTTLRDTFSKLDLILFVADKIEWDQQGVPPYINEITDALAISLEKAAYTYIDYKFKSNELKVVHPWILEAYLNLNKMYK